VKNRTAYGAVLAIVLAIGFPLFRWHQHADHIALLQQQYADAGTLVDSYRTTLNGLALAASDFNSAAAGISEATASSANLNVVASANALSSALSAAKARADVLSDAFESAQRQLPPAAIAAAQPGLTQFASDAAVASTAFAKAAAISTTMGQEPFLTLGERDSRERAAENAVSGPTRALQNDATNVLGILRAQQLNVAAAHDAKHDELSVVSGARVVGVIFNP
jgi:hypothetical protein